MRHFRLSSVLLIVAFAGLPTLAQAQKKNRGDRNKITHEELLQSAGLTSTAFDLIQIIRPYWLEPPRGRVASPNGDGFRDGGSDLNFTAVEIVVYVDGNRQPSVEQLKTLRLVSILEMRYLDQQRALQIRGPGHEKGVIEVTLQDVSKR
jgi:hypothetical protein